MPARYKANCHARLVRFGHHGDLLGRRPPPTPFPAAEHFAIHAAASHNHDLTPHSNSRGTPRPVNSGAESAFFDFCESLIMRISWVGRIVRTGLALHYET